MKENSNLGVSQEASLVGNKATHHGAGMIDYFDVVCHDKDGNFKWKESFKNLVTNEGLSYLIQAAFTGEDVAITSWFVGLKNTGAEAATDNAAALPNVGNWTEYTTYDEATRPALVLENEAGQATSNSVTAATFTINATNSVFGAFVVDSNAKNTATGATVLYGVGDFASAKAVDAGDTLNVTVTLSAASA